MSRPATWDEKVDVVTDHYIIAALWADAEEGTHPKCSKAERAKARAACERFMSLCNHSEHGRLFDLACGRFEYGYGQHPDAGSAEAAFGHDMYLTTAGHGVGFWDRSELKNEVTPGLTLGDALTRMAKLFGEPYAYQYRGWFYFNSL